MSAAIVISRPTAQYTVDGNAHVQFEWWSASAPATRHRGSYTPTQEQLAARAPSGVLALVTDNPDLAGYWGDAEVTADALAYMAAAYGFSDVSIDGSG